MKGSPPSSSPTSTVGQELFSWEKGRTWSGALPKIPQPGRVPKLGLLSPRPLLTHCVVQPLAALRGRGRGRAVLTLKIFSCSNHTIPQMAGLVPHAWLCACELSREVLFLPALRLINGRELILGTSVLNFSSWHFALFIPQTQLYYLLRSWQDTEQDSIISDG